MQAITDKTSLHSVYVVDEEGMGKIFSELKRILASQGDYHTTLVYFSPETNFIFDRELEILQKRYPTLLILYPLGDKIVDASTALQELLEAVINSNTKHRLTFILSGNNELIHIVSNQLWFLGISKNQSKTIF